MRRRTSKSWGNKPALAWGNPPRAGWRAIPAGLAGLGQVIGVLRRLAGLVQAAQEQAPPQLGVQHIKK